MKIRATFTVDPKLVREESGQENIRDAISQELNWTHDSGIFVDGYEILPERYVATVLCNSRITLQRIVDFSGDKAEAEAIAYANQLLKEEVEKAGHTKVLEEINGGVESGNRWKTATLREDGDIIAFDYTTDALSVWLRYIG